VFRKTLSLFGCLALFVLHSHGLASSSNAGGCGWVGGLACLCLWEWWRSMRPPAGRAMSCIKLLPLPPPSGSYWLVGRFQQCRVFVWSCCCSLSVARRLQCRVVVLCRLCAWRRLSCSFVPGAFCFFHAPVSPSCRCCVLVLVACVLESWNQNFV